MAIFTFVVYSNAAEGTDDEFNQWYDEVHLPEVLQVPGFVAAQRFRVTDFSAAEQSHRYLALYEVEADDPATAMRDLAEAVPNMRMTATLTDPKTAFFEPLGDRLTR